MALGLVMDFEAKPGTNLIALYDQLNIDMRTHEDPPDGLIFHWGAKSPKGLRVVDVWESQGHFDRFFQERLGPSSQKLGLPQPNLEKFEVHSTLKGRSFATT